jgi:hypothetical protein
MAEPGEPRLINPEEDPMRNKLIALLLAGLLALSAVACGGGARRGGGTTGTTSPTSGAT